jgi:hypothetical protein
MLKLSSVGLLSILLVPVFNLPASAQNNSFTIFQNVLPQAAWNENWRSINQQQQQERYGNTDNNSAPRFRSPNPSNTYSPTKRFISYEQQKVCESLLKRNSSPAWTQLYQQTGCKDGNAPKYFSMRGEQPVSLKFINQRNHRINIYWLDYRGIAQFYRSLAPGEWYIQQTFMTHPWLVSDENNRSLGAFLPDRSIDEAIIR